MSIAQLPLEEVTEAPSHIKIARVLRDSDDLSKWAKALDSHTRKAAEALPVPDLPRIAKYRAKYPVYS